MPNPRLASRYAKSLVDLAIETGQLDPVYQDLQLLANTCRESRELVSFMRNPVINADKKEKIFAALFDNKLTALTDRFSRLLIRKGRENYLPEIAEEGIRQYRAYKHIREVRITTATPISEELRQEIIHKVQSEIKDQQIELRSEVDERLIGGFVLESDNNLFDASILRDLKDVKAQFEKNVFVRNIR
jgi:F-type H+-transporting ATPase subunit delta